jgi:hypothetical protein
MRDPEPAVEPELLRRTDGKAVIVRGSLNVLNGEPAAGKSWLLAEAVRQLVVAGERVVLLDYESGPRMLSARLVDLGVPADAVEQHLTYIRPGGFDPSTVARLVVALEPALVIIDSLALALAQAGVDEDNNGEVLRFLAILCRPLTDIEAAVVAIDHVVKNKETRGRFGRGAGSKLYDVDVAFSLELVEPFARGHNGSAVLRIQKDRYGSIGPERSIAATVTFTTTIDGLQILLEAPLDSDEPWKPADCMAAIIEVLQMRGGEGLSQRRLIEALRAIGKGFKDSTIREAAERLAMDPSSLVVVRTGAKNARLYSYVPALTPVGQAVDFDTEF